MMVPKRLPGHKICDPGGKWWPVMCTGRITICVDHLEILYSSLTFSKAMGGQ